MIEIFASSEPSISYSIIGGVDLFDYLVDFSSFRIKLLNLFLTAFSVRFFNCWAMYDHLFP